MPCKLAAFFNDNKTPIIATLAIISLVIVGLILRIILIRIICRVQRTSNEGASTTRGPVSTNFYFLFCKLLANTFILATQSLGIGQMGIFICVSMTKHKK